MVTRPHSHPFSTRLSASFSSAVTHSPYAAFTSTYRAAYSHRPCGGSHPAASEAFFCSFKEPFTASKFRGSLAKFRRFSSSQLNAPVCHAFASATTWSICTCPDVFAPR